jgi:lysozyme
MAPYVCPGGELTIGYGCTKWFGGRDVVESDRLVDEAHAMALLQAQVVEYEDAVRDLVTVPLNSNQFSGLVSFAFNKGIAGLAGSTILARTNERRFDDAAEAFGMWLYATTGKRKRALRGLLRRSYAESCLYMGLSWDVACSNDAVALVAEPPPNDIGADRVIFKTPFRDMLLVALRYPLPPLDDELVLTQPASPRVPAVEAAQRQPDPARLPAAAGAATTKTAAASPAAAQAARAGVPPPSPPPVPAKVAPPPLPKDAAPASIEPKDMVLSKRFWGLFITGAGTLEFLPNNLSKWINNEGNRELIAWVIVVVVGYIIYKYGQRKATRPLK